MSPAVEKMPRLVAELHAQFAESAKLRFHLNPGRRSQYDSR